MKVTSTVKPPKPVAPEVTEVNISLTPREALLLAYLVGNMNAGDIVNQINSGGYIRKNNHVCKFPNDLKGEASFEEGLLVGSLYSQIMRIFGKKN